ncbi:hypothetical protein [Burkholderia ubonensis]|uniref:hypothetical protein n=1 Tax=Burkholderia ubonensis TaxID=101571 RepID=UPI000F55D742|nr:hypothetical protein [Burkholderia ubonensis]RQP34143.1 hypothetical protein DF155_15770 [Burkholderia ubonensis]RQP40401.1 hypothetical protein DF154_13780 [Burkholderia ubonensis]RQP40540.1 hypothetical protein DF156_16220 [Burkholderia ubonensis]RQP53934.1 hypothetical protein DF144_16115 [Burkholderia ubonensis]RQP57416.1 hypothetical protein DF159_22315 [Burkholderia ubonensis]
MSARHWSFVLATAATGTALSLSILAGWQRGGALAERVVWVAIGIVLVVSAHLLPALIRDAPLGVRGVGSLLWGACLATACYGHAVFFVTAQQHAGELRASAVSPTQPTGRSLTVVMGERATVAAQLASANARYCAGNCRTLEARRATLAARLDALNAEADDVRRQQAATDRVTAQRDALRVDPVTSRLATLLGVTTPRVDLVSGLLFAAVLEGVACLLWTVALRSPARETESAITGVTSPVVPAVTVPADVTAPVVATVTNVTDSDQPAVIPVVTSHADETVSRKAENLHYVTASGSRAPRNAPVAPAPTGAPIDDHLPQLIRDVTAGLVRPTVADIRRHVGCSQARATALRRQLAELNVRA